MAEDQGARVDVPSTNGLTALLFAAQRGHQGVVQYLAEEQSASVNSTTRDSKMALMLAAPTGRLEIVQYLTEMRDVRERH